MTPYFRLLMCGGRTRFNAVLSAWVESRMIMVDSSKIEMHDGNKTVHDGNGSSRSVGTMQVYSYSHKP